MSQPLFDSDQRVRATIKPGFLKSIRDAILAPGETWYTDPSGYIYPLNHLQKGDYKTFDLSYDPSTPSPGSSLTQSQSIDFNLYYSPNYHIIDNDGIWLEINVSNTSGTNTVTPTFAELFFDDAKGIEFMINGSSIYQVPSTQILLEPALELPDTQYKNLASLANHDNMLAYNASAKSAIAASGSAQYIIRVANPFPSDGFWLGALGKNTLTIRLHTVNGGAVDSGTGTLNLVSFRLHMTCLAVPSDQFPVMEQLWSKRLWRCTEVVRNQPISYTLTSTGDSPKIKMDSFRDEQCIFMLTMLRVSRAIAGTALLNLTSPAATSTIRIESKDGTIINSSSAIPYQFLEKVLSLRHFGSSDCIENLNLIPTYFAPNASQSIHHEIVDGVYYFTGDENFIISNSGSTSAVYTDSYGWMLRTFSCVNGVIQRMSKS